MKKFSTFKTYFSTPKGFMAFSLVLLLSAVVLLIVTTVSIVSIGELQASHGLYYGENSLGVVESCVEDALMRINNNSSFTSQTFQLTNPDGTWECSVTVNSPDPNWDITVYVSGFPASYSTVGKQFQRKIRVTFTRNPPNMTLTSWREIE